MLWNDCINLKYAAITLITSLGKFLILSIIKCYILFYINWDLTLCVQRSSDFLWKVISSDSYCKLSQDIEARHDCRVGLGNFRNLAKQLGLPKPHWQYLSLNTKDLNRGAVLYLLFFYFNLAPNQAYLINRPQEKLATLFHVSIWRQVSKNIFKIQLL